MKAIERRFEFTVPAPRERVFELLSDARNLDRVTPTWFAFRILSRDPGRMFEGAEIEYQLRWRWLRFRWCSRIFDWRPPESFAYEQLTGPFRRFVHEHAFEARLDGTTRITDRVIYSPPGGRLSDALVVKRDLERIFSFREDRVRSLLAKAAIGSVGPARSAE